MSPDEFVEAVKHITRVTLLNVEPGATVLLEVDHPLTMEQVHNLKAHAAETFKPHNVAVLAGGVRVAGLRIESAGADDSTGSGPEAKTYGCGPCGARFDAVGALLDHMHHCGSPPSDASIWPRFRLWGRR